MICSNRPSNHPLCVRVAEALTRIPIILVSLFILTACHSKKQLTEEQTEIDLSALRALSLFDTTFIFTPSLKENLTNHPTQSQTIPAIKIIRHANLTDKTETKEHKQTKASTEQAPIKSTNPADGYIRYAIIFLLILISISVVSFIIRLTKFLV